MLSEVLALLSDILVKHVPLALLLFPGTDEGFECFSSKHLAKLKVSVLDL